MTPLINPDFWRNKRVFLSGHTGLKGAWLAAWLLQMEARVHGYALAPDYPDNVYDVLDLKAQVSEDIADIRDCSRLQGAIADFQPHVILHLAAQPLVRYSYDHPLDTFSTNIMGTANILMAAQASKSLESMVVVTTDKCYLNQELQKGYDEDQPLGGHDPYSASKACAEIVTNSWHQSYLQGRNGSYGLATARAGNVIGGGDRAIDRLIPDVIRAVAADTPLEIRNPEAVRPWQYVLDPLAGYLHLAQACAAEPEAFSGPWNFGPDPEDVKSVGWVVEFFLSQMGIEAPWSHTPTPSLHETSLLFLNCSKAKTRLGWAPRHTLEEALTRVARWEAADNEKNVLKKLLTEEIDTYMKHFAQGPT